MVDKVMFESGGSYEWGTPQDLYDDLDAAFHFILDPAASSKNAKAEFYYTTEDDGLSRPWRIRAPGSVFVNPPYGRNVGRWIEKAWTEAKYVDVVMLLPARTDTRWWHDLVMLASQIWLIKGRLTFEGADNCAPFPSCIVVYLSRQRARGFDNQLAGMWHSSDLDCWLVNGLSIEEAVGPCLGGLALPRRLGLD